MDQRGDWRLTDALSYEHGRGDPFAAAVRATRMPMVITNPRLPDNPIVFCNQAFQDLTGYDREEIVGRNCRFLQGPETDRDAVSRVREAIEHGWDIEANLLNYRKDGSKFWNALYLSPVRGDDGVINYFFASQLDISDRIHFERRAAERQEEVEREVAARTADLQHALEAKTLLLHELDHRVKNNLTMIGSVLRLQARATDDKAVVSHLEEMLQRVDALGTVHRRIYESNDVSRFDVASFMGNLAADLASAMAPDRIKLHTDLAPFDVAAGQASAIALVLNELLTGAIMRASADGRSGTLHLRSAVVDNRASIEITDDGPPMPDAGGKRLGRSLIERLSRQIGVQTSWTSSPAGNRVGLSLPLDLA